MQGDQRRSRGRQWEWGLRPRPRPCLLLMFVLVVGAEWGAARVVGPRFLTPAGSFAGDALNGLLRGRDTAAGSCSVALVADHSATPTALLQPRMKWHAQGGTTILQLPASFTPVVTTNTTISGPHQSLDEIIELAKQVRVASRCLTVVFASDDAAVLKLMLDRAVDGRLMLWSTYVIILTTLSKPTALAAIKDKWAFTMMNTHLMVLRHQAERSSALVVRHEPYSPEGARTRLVAVYTTQRGLSTTTSLHFNKFDNFFGGFVNFTTLTYRPFIGRDVIILPNGTKTFEFSGTDYELVSTFGTTLNFTLKYKESENWGQVEADISNRVSFIIPCIYFMMPHRLKQFDFVAPYIIDDLAFSMRIPSMLSSWDRFLKPFYMEVWLFTLATVIILAVSLILMFKYSLKDNVVYAKIRGGARLNENDGELSFVRSIFEVFGALIGQDFTFKMPDTTSFRILLTAWFLFIIVLTTGYKSKLVSFMTLPKAPSRPETLSELVESNAKITAPPWGEVQRKMLASSANEEHRIIASRYLFVPSIIKGLQTALTDGTAHMEGRPFQSYAIAENFMRQDGTTDFYTGREGILSFIASLPIPHNAPFKPQFDRVMLAIVQAGMYHKWRANEIEQLRISKVEEIKNNADGDGIPAAVDDNAVKPLTLSQLQGPFWISICGCSISIVCFVLELFYQKIVKKWRTTRKK